MSAYGFNEDKSKAFLPVLKSDIQLSNNAQETIASFFSKSLECDKRYFRQNSVRRYYRGL